MYSRSALWARELTALPTWTRRTAWPWYSEEAECSGEADDPAGDGGGPGCGGGRDSLITVWTSDDDELSGIVGK